MMMTTEEFRKKLKEISRKLVIRVSADPKNPKALGIVYVIDQFHDRIIYNFASQKYDEENCLKFIPTKIHDLNKLLDEYYKCRKEILACDSEDSVDSTDTESKTQGHSAKELGETVKEFGEAFKNFNLKTNSKSADDNPFKKYTDKLAETLLEKNTAYGDSFSQSVDDYGLKVIGIRLSDKYNRIKHLVNAGSLKENDESLEDTLLDTAGYAILALKYLKEHEKNDR